MMTMLQAINPNEVAPSPELGEGRVEKGTINKMKKEAEGQELNQDFSWAALFGTGMILLLAWVAILAPLSGNTAISLIGSEKLAWYLTRTSGTVGYILLATSTVWGLLLSTKVVKDLIPAPVTLAMHNYLSWTAIGITAFHAFVLLFDSYYTYSIADLLIPFTGPYKPMWVGVGTIGFYLMLLTSVSFYMRKTIGQKTWRKLHYLTFGVYIMGTLHGWMAGTDSALLGPMYLVSSVLVVFLTAYRVMDAMSKS